MAGITIRMARTGLLSAAIALTFGCARFLDRGPVFTATSTITADPAIPRGEGLRQATLRAEVEARDQILFQASQLKLSDGRKLQDLAIIDPTLRAQLDDLVRGAQIKNKEFNDDGSVTVTVRLELQPLYDAIEAYPVNKIQ